MARRRGGLLRRLRVSSRWSWRSDRGLALLLAMLVAFVFVVTPLLGNAAISSELGLALYSLVAVSGVAAVMRSRTMALLAGTGAVGSSALDWIAHYRPSRGLGLLDAAIRTAFIAAIAVVVLKRVYRPGDVNYHRVLGAIVVYLLAGLACAHAYEMMMIINPAAFRLDPREAAPLWHPGIFRYFSFSTLTTLGYGDVLPVSPAARALACGEAVFGQLYPTVMIARLISLEIARRPRR